MIIAWLLSVVIDVLEATLGILPNVPATPAAIVTGGDWVISTVDSVISVLKMIYGGPLLIAITVVIIGIFTFEWIYHTVLWVIHKLPFLNIH